MTEFRPLLESSTSATARELLRSGLGDAPPPESMARVAGALGVTLTAAAIAVPAGAATVNGALAGGLGAAGKASGVSAMLVGKWLASGLVAGALVSGTATVVERVRDPSPASEHVAMRTTAMVPAPASTPGLAPPKSEPAVDAPATDSSAAAVFPAPSFASTAQPAPESSASRALGAEAARIDAARRALERGDARRALTELDWYERSRVVGVLDREAALLRIQALVRLGDKAHALELARYYLAKHPEDAYAARLRELIRSQGATFPGGEGTKR